MGMDIIKMIKVGNRIYKQLKFPVCTGGYRARWTACDDQGKALRDGKSSSTLGELIREERENATSFCCIGGGF